MIDRKVFFDEIRKSFGSFSQSQVDGFEQIIRTWEILHPEGDLRMLGYILATAWHETARTMQPIYERGSRKYFRKYEPGTRIGKRLGNTVVGDGYRFRGRGYVQLTGRRNYSDASRRLGVDLVKDPDKALEPELAAKILINGMMGGWFTGKGLPQYIKKKADYVRARRTVNGLDRAKQIASYARKLSAALRKAWKAELDAFGKRLSEALKEKQARKEKQVRKEKPKPKRRGRAALVSAILAAAAASAAAFFDRIMQFLGFGG